MKQILASLESFHSLSNPLDQDPKLKGSTQQNIEKNKSSNDCYAKSTVLSPCFCFVCYFLS